MFCCHCYLAYKLLRVRKVAYNSTRVIHKERVGLTRGFASFSRREKRQKIEDIKKNIRDAILVRLAYLQSTTHI